MRAYDRDLIRGGHYGQRPRVPHLKAEHMAAPTNAANVKKALANSEPSTHGTSRHFAAPQNLSPIGLTTDKRLALGPDGSAAIDPKQTSRTRRRRLIDLRYGFELATEGPEIRSDFTPLALQKRACRRGARNHEIGTETIELAITATGISFIASACSGVAKTRMAPTPKVTACTIM